MLILIDTREKPQAVAKIIDEFQQQRILYDRTKLYIGDFQEFGNPYLVIDRKQSLDELAANLTTDKERFKREIGRAKVTGTKIVILVEQDSYSDRGSRVQIKTIEDLMLWQSRHSTVTGEKLYRVLVSWLNKYPIEIRFCRKAETGKEIIKILGGQK